MKLTMTAPLPTSTSYTAAQTWRFFLIGAFRSTILSLGPVVAMLYNGFMHWGQEKIYWPDVWVMVLGAAGPALSIYVITHRQLLKVPEILDIPEEFGGSGPGAITHTHTDAVSAQTGPGEVTEVSTTVKTVMPLAPVTRTGTGTDIGSGTGDSRTTPTI